MIWKLFGNLIILYRILFLPMSNCSGEEKYFICVKTQQWFKENVDGHTWHVFPSCQGCEEMGCTCRPADLHKPTRKRPEQAGVSTPEYVIQPEGTAFTMFPSWLLFKITETSQLPGPGVHTQLRRLVCEMSLPNLSLRRLVTTSIPH